MALPAAGLELDSWAERTVVVESRFRCGGLVQQSVSAQRSRGACEPFDAAVGIWRALPGARANPGGRQAISLRPSHLSASAGRASAAFVLCSSCASNAGGA